MKSSLVAGVQLNYISDDVLQIECTLLRKKNNVVEIEKQETFNSIEDLFSSINNSTAMFLSVDGKGILHKKVEVDKTQDIDTDELFNQAFPSLNANDFYIQENKIGQELIYLSLVRKLKIDKLLQELNDRKYFIQGLTLGPFDIRNILELLEHSNDFIWTNNYKVIHSNSEINDLIKVDNIPENIYYQFGEENFSNESLVSFATAFKYFIEYSDYKSDLLSIIDNQKEEFLYKRIFKLSGWSILIVVFAILMGNYLFFDHYFSKNNDLITRYGQNKNLIIKLENLREEFKTKESFFNDNSILQTSKLSFYSDRIGLLLPHSLSLNKIDIQPLAKKIQYDEAIEFLKDVIYITGNSDNSQNFNLWIKKLKKEPWITRINIINYSQENVRKSGEFEIEIIIKSD
jgi:hypothetical protein